MSLVLSSLSLALSLSHHVCLSFSLPPSLSYSFFLLFSFLFLFLFLKIYPLYLILWLFGVIWFSIIILDMTPSTISTMAFSPWNCLFVCLRETLKSCSLCSSGKAERRFTPSKELCQAGQVEKASPCAMAIQRCLIPNPSTYMPPADEFFPFIKF